MDQIKEILREYLPVSEDKWVLVFVGVVIAALVAFLCLWNVVFAIAMFSFFDALNPSFIVRQWWIDQEGPYGVSAAITWGVIGILMLQGIRDHKQRGLHGRAKWANEFEINNSGLRDETGILLGVKNGRYLCSNTEGFVCVYAPTGTGKSVGFVIPNLLNYPDSGIVLDTKLELFKKTSGFRAKHGQKVFLWAPGYGEDGTDEEERTHCFNPLDIVSRDPLYRVADLKRIAAILWPPSEDGGEIWQPSARSIFTAMSMDLVDSGQHLTFGNLYRLFAQTPDIEGYLESQVEKHFDPDHPLTLDAVELVAVNKFLGKASKERSGVISSFDAKMEVFEDPLVDAACSRTDFDIAELRKQRMTIYVGVNPSDLDRLQPLLNLFFQLVITRLTKREPDPIEEPYKVFLCLDEFPRLGKIEKIKEGIDYLRSYGFRVMIITQSMSKIREIYGDHAAENYIQNFQYIVGYAPNSQKEAKEISDMLGKKTVRSVSRSHSKNGVSTTISMTGRELMTADEVRRFSERKELIIVRNRNPIKAKKIAWYKDKGLMSRIEDPIELPLLNAREFKAQRDQEFNDKLKAYLLDKAAQEEEATQQRQASSRKKSQGGNTNASGANERYEEYSAMDDYYAGDAGYSPYSDSAPVDPPVEPVFDNADDEKRLSILEGYF